MNPPVALTILLLTASLVAAGTLRARTVSIGGDVPRPGPIDFPEDGITLHAAIAEAGMDLAQFYGDGNGNRSEEPCPIRVSVHRRGALKTYDPSTEAGEMRTENLQAHDVIAVTDFRKYPNKIETSKQRIERMLQLGSTEIGEEILALATLHHEHDARRGGKAPSAEGFDSALRKEVVRLAEEGNNQKIIGLLELRLGALHLEGLGQAHPKVEKTKKLIQMFTKLNRTGEQDAGGKRE